MKVTLRRIGVLKAAVMGGIGYAIMGLIFVPFFLFLALFAPATGGPDDWAFGPVFALMLPLFYGVAGFVGAAIGAAVYNLLAMMVGGLELELDPAEGAAPVMAPTAPPAPPAPPPPQSFTGY